MKSCFDVGCGPIVNLLQGLGRDLKTCSQKRWGLHQAERREASAAKDHEWIYFCFCHDLE